MEQLEQQIESFVQIGWLNTALVAVIIVVVTALVARLVSKFLRHVLQLDESMLPASSIFVNIARSAIWVMGACVLFSTCFNVDVTAAIAALGIGGIAISLGFQDTISNLIGGLQVSLMRIVKPGDNIEVGSERGVVCDVTWRHTTIKNSLGETVIIPNSIMNKTALVHLPSVNQVKLPLVVATNGENLDAVAASIEKRAAAAAQKIDILTKTPVVTFTDITDYGFKGSLVFSIDDKTKAVQAKDAVLRAVAPFTRPLDPQSEEAVLVQHALDKKGAKDTVQNSSDAHSTAVQHRDKP